MSSNDSTFILRTDGNGSGPRLAVKDLIDVKGLPTTGGSRALAERAQPSTKDAACLAGARAADSRIVGLTNLHELAFGTSGVNAWTGTPVNPLDSQRIPGGSSSGSAVAVANGDADVAFGTDTTGSIRVPAACCGVVGLKTTADRISLQGVWPISSTLDTVGPLGRTVADVTLGMTLLEPGFAVETVTGVRVGRFRLPANPAIDDAIDRALKVSELEITDVTLADWQPACKATSTVAGFDGWRANRELFESFPELIGEDVYRDLEETRLITQAAVNNAFAVRETWQRDVRNVFNQVDVIVMPTLTDFPPCLESADEIWTMMGTRAWNLAGVPALSIPVPTDIGLPVGLQLIGPWNREALLLALGTRIEAAISPWELPSFTPRSP